MKKIILVTILFVIKFAAFAQPKVTRLYTDYNGFFTSASNAVNPLRPHHDHNLLGFTYNGTTYSTGVDDAKLTTNSVSFVPQTFRAIPLNNVPTSGPSYYVGLGQMVDGIHNGVNNSSTAPFVGDPISATTLASFLTDGINGLNIGTGLANIPVGSVLQFNLGSSGISASAIGDGIPDILFVQIADPSSGGDRMKFINSSGATVGTEYTFNLSSTFLYPRLAYWKADFYNPNSTQVSASFINTERPIAMLALDLADLGINSTNYTNVVQLVYTTGGTADPAFVAFNEPSVSLPSRLGIVSQPTVYQTNVAMNPEFQVRLLNSFNQPVLQANVAITVSLESGNGTLAGTFTRLTDANGIAHFGDIVSDGNDTHTVRFTSSSLTPAVSGPIVWSTLLPVRWAGFNGIIKGSETHLNWSTSLEQYTQDFVIQHSSNGNNWTAVGTVKAAGNTSYGKTYSHIHQNPLPGINYYRILQRDIDGRQSYSSIIRVQFKTSNTEVRILSNPVQSKQLWVETNSSTSIRLFNAAGHLVLTKELGSGRQAISVSNFAAGLYYIQTSDRTIPIVIQ